MGCPSAPTIVVNAMDLPMGSTGPARMHHAAVSRLREEGPSRSRGIGSEGFSQGVEIAGRKRQLINPIVAGVDAPGTIVVMDGPPTPRGPRAVAAGGSGGG